MSDITVAAALRSNARLVVIEAPAGCGKTHQAADYAHWLAMAPEACEALKRGHPVDLRGRLPSGLQIINADNISPQAMGFRLELIHGRKVSATIRNAESMMIDFRREFHDAIRLALFADPQKGLLEMARAALSIPCRYA